MSIEKAVGLNRRQFLLRVSAGAAAFAGLGKLSLNSAKAEVIAPWPSAKRRQDCFDKRVLMAQMNFNRPFVNQVDNGDEELYDGPLGHFTKGLPHFNNGEADGDAYQFLKKVLRNQNWQAAEDIPLGGTAKLRNTFAGLAFDHEGLDGACTYMPPAPAFASAERGGEWAENAWMAILRDVPYSQFGSNALVAAACADLNGLSDFRGPKISGQVTPATLFRGEAPGCLIGPYLSQFLVRDIPMGANTISGKIHTTISGVNHMTTWADWLNVQRGGSVGPDHFDAVPKYMRNGRDIGQWVHVDALYQGYLQAALYLMSIGAPNDMGNPYANHPTMDGFGTFGGPHILSLVTEVATRALKAVWFQKWFVHRTIRPEAFGGRVHRVLTGQSNYPVHADALNSSANAQIFSQYGTYLLPQAFPEGSPLHPSYGAGHATVAGACTTILKAWFDENWVIPNPVQASLVGQTLEPYTGADAGQITVGGELNKVAANVGIGRNFAGVHWRSDHFHSMKLGEDVAIAILEEQKQTYAEPIQFHLTKFDGTQITI